MNTLNDSSSENIHLLIERYYLDELSVEEQHQLETALLADRELRDRFRSAASVDATLRYRSGDDPIVHRPTGIASQHRWWFLAVAAIAATLLVIAGQFRDSLSFPRNESSQAANQLSGTTQADQPLARLVVENGLSIKATPDLNLDDGLSAGTYEATSGEGTLRFENGVEITLTAPAEFRLIDAMHVEWQLGRGRATVPPEGHGFRVLTPQGEIEDLGTEFGFLVAEDQSSEVHVFAGEVRLFRDAEPPQSVREDMAVQISRGKSQALASTSSDAFATRGQVGFRRWQAARNRLRRDPATIVYYDFQPDAANVQRLIDLSTTDMHDGRIAGGISASGRWPEKAALLLERPGDRIELSIPGEFPTVSMLAWFQINRFDQPLQTLFNTYDWDEGEHHLNITRSGELRVGLPDDYTATIATPPITAGKWTLLAYVIDQKHARYYLDGELVLKIAREKPKPIVFGDCSIGAFGRTTTDAGGAPQVEFGREMRGRIDEFVLLERALTHDEIRHAYEDGLDQRP